MIIVTKPVLHSYVVSDGNQSVNLIIDYRLREFNIVPNNKSSFGFEKASRNESEYLLETLDLIKSAMDYACNLLKDEVKPDDRNR